MSGPLTHEEIQNLLGVYALDAVDADEREAVELHLRECPRCRSEVADYREVAVLLAHSGAPAPADVWDRILEELEPSPPALRMPGLPAGATVDRPERDVADGATDLGGARAARDATDRRRRSLPTRLLAGVVAAAAIIVAVVGFAAVRQADRLDRMEAALRDESIDRLATRTLTDPAAANTMLRSTDGTLAAPVAIGKGGTGYLFASKMPVLPSGRTYQLWGQVGGAVVSLGVFDGRTGVVPFQVGAGQRQKLQGFAVTEEATPGVSAPRNAPLVSGAI